MKYILSRFLAFLDVLNRKGTRKLKWLKNSYKICNCKKRNFALKPYFISLKHQLPFTQSQIM